MQNNVCCNIFWYYIFEQKQISTFNIQNMGEKWGDDIINSLVLRNFKKCFAENYEIS